MCRFLDFIFFFFNDTATTEIYTLSLHDALPIFVSVGMLTEGWDCNTVTHIIGIRPFMSQLLCERSEEHTSELQSQSNLVCRLLLEKKKTRHYVVAQRSYLLYSPKTRIYMFHL